MEKWEYELDRVKMGWSGSDLFLHLIWIRPSLHCRVNYVYRYVTPRPTSEYGMQMLENGRSRNITVKLEPEEQRMQTQQVDYGSAFASMDIWYRKGSGCWRICLSGLQYFLVHLAMIPITGTGIKLARGLGSAIIYNKEHEWNDHLVYHLKEMVIGKLAYR
ncbi:transmembrane protein [Artemisia annua]|uniref:Transmembrane protein n=1 Tax=Artemisia annua TaxID=35608 RepID=A0A2U1MRT2_ARTAN|nr:transmembrane protein [Artemisia annua]